MIPEAIEGVRVVLPERALMEIFDECDRFDQDETGGRVIGSYDQRGDHLTIQVRGVIGPGPNARRTSVSFFQDGEYQEGVFRRLEGTHPSLEHLGNWHTHHVNGLPRLSGGDIDTYRNTVEHPQHNTNFFYALLVVAKHDGEVGPRRYAAKHYLFRRGDRHVYEIAPTHVSIVDEPLLWPTSTGENDNSVGHPSPRSERAADKEVLRELFAGMHPYSSKRLGFYWRGPLELADGSRAEVVVVEQEGDSGNLSYSVTLRDPAPTLRPVVARLAEQEFSSARVALVAAERTCNRALVDKHLAGERALRRRREE